MHALIVEDEPNTAAYLKRGLSEYGFVADVVDNGLQAVHFALNQTYDALILDVMIPD